MEYCSAMKKNKIMSFAASGMQLEISILSKGRQEEKDQYRMISLTCGICTQINLPTKQNRITDMENRLVVARGDGFGGKTEGKVGVSRCKLLYTGRRNNKVLLYSPGDSIQHPVINHNRKEYFKTEYIHTYITESLCCAADINITL